MLSRRAALLADLRRVELPREQWPQETLRPCHRVDRATEISFARDLLSRGMALLVPEEEIPVGLDGKELVGG